jgi:hypothetical protein
MEGTMSLRTVCDGCGVVIEGLTFPAHVHLETEGVLRRLDDGLPADEGEHWCQNCYRVAKRAVADWVAVGQPDG